MKYICHKEKEAIKNKTLCIDNSMNNANLSMVLCTMNASDNILKGETTMTKKELEALTVKITNKFNARLTATIEGKTELSDKLEEEMHNLWEENKENVEVMAVFTQLDNAEEVRQEALIVASEQAEKVRLEALIVTNEVAIMAIMTEVTGEAKKPLALAMAEISQLETVILQSKSSLRVLSEKASIRNWINEKVALEPVFENFLDSVMNMTDKVSLPLVFRLKGQEIIIRNTTESDNFISGAKVAPAPKASKSVAGSKPAKEKKDLSVVLTDGRTFTGETWSKSLEMAFCEVRKENGLPETSSGYASSGMKKFLVSKGYLTT